VSPNKREREYARRRHEQWMERQRTAKMRRRRTRIATIAAVGVLGIVGVIALVSQTANKSAAVSSSSSSTTPSAAASATPTSTSPSTAATPPSPTLAEARAWTVDLTTSAGNLGITLDGALAPQAVASFVYLAKLGYFDNTSCHRLTVTGIYVLQCGDPTGSGSGGPSYRFGPIENAPADNVYPAGTVAMARVGNDANSQGSQFFIVYKDSPIPADTAGGYTVFGHVTTGLDVVTIVAASGVSGGKTDGPPSIPVTIQGVAVK
jgi:peptidyl-prolyl cis-trans isomerase B (cyclophilin B)